MNDVTEDSMMIVGHERRRGRAPRAGAPGRPMSVRLAPAELSRVEQAAGVNRQTISEFMRDALVTAAEDCLESNS